MRMYIAFSIGMLAVIATQQNIFAEIKMTDLDSIRVEAEVVSGIVFSDSLPGTGFLKGDQFPANFESLNMDKFDCYAILPINSFSLNKSFFEKDDNGQQIRAGAKLVSIDGGFTIGGNWNLVTLSRVASNVITIYMQIVGRAPRNPIEKPGADYDLAISCPGRSESDLISMDKNKWTIDIDAVSRSFNEKLSGILSTKFIVQ